MTRFTSSILLALFSLLPAPITPAADPPSHQSGHCTLEDRYFETEVWAKVGERVCLKCHISTGDAKDSRFLLSPIEGDESRQRETLAANRRMFETMSLADTDGENSAQNSRLLLKVAGKLDHGGGEVLKPDSKELRVLLRYVRRLRGEKPADPAPDPTPAPSTARFFDGTTMLSPKRLFRRITLSLAGRLPTPAELEAIDREGPTALNPLLDALMKEEAFYLRLKEAFNDIFLTVGFEDNAETLLSYEHFELTRNWYDKYNLDDVPEADREKSRWRLADVYRDSLLREPMELIAHVVREERPFSEILTADYIMVSPYTARGYGLFEDIKAQFKNPEDPFEYIPARLNALKSRDGTAQESSTGKYPHAGFLTTFHYLRRYPSTDTNRNRLRARSLYQHFLGIDIMQLAPRVTDAAAVTAKYPIPTMQAADCVVCHKTIDPAAGLFQDFNNEGSLGPRKDGWYTDMFAPGFEGEDLPSDQRWRAGQWVAERIAKDPRFAVAMVEHVYYLLTGRKVLQPPEDIDHPMFAAHRRAYRAQRTEVDLIADRFRKADMNLKEAIRGWIDSDFYRVDLPAQPLPDGPRKVELDDVGLVRLLSPEQLERKVRAVFGEPWGHLEDETKILYGGIDSLTVTERIADPSGAMGALQRMLANDVACLNVAKDFRRPPAERLLFPTIEPDVIPADDASNKKIRRAIVHLHDRILGREDTLESPEVQRTFDLFTGILKDAHSQEGLNPRETYFCGGREDYHTDDPKYTIRAWRGVVTYLLRQHEFLYE